MQKEKPPPWKRGLVQCILDSYLFTTLSPPRRRCQVLWYLWFVCRKAVRVFPWGLFLLLGPRELLVLFGLGSVYWRILGGFSLLGALIYYFPYQFYRRKLTRSILIFGAFDNLIAGLVVIFLFMFGRIPLIAFSSFPLLFYFSYFFFDQARVYKRK